MEISKELLNEVLNKNISSYEFDMYGNIDYKVVNDYGSNINIYELANKCKEWAFDNFYLSIITFKINDNLYKCEIVDIIDSLGEWTTKYSFRIDTEHEAIFKACQWILDKITSK